MLLDRNRATYTRPFRVLTQAKLLACFAHAFFAQLKMQGRQDLNLTDSVQVSYTVQQELNCIYSTSSSPDVRKEICVLRPALQGRQDLNLQPTVLETVALPIAPHPFAHKLYYM